MAQYLSCHFSSEGLAGCSSTAQGYQPERGLNIQGDLALHAEYKNETYVAWRPTFPTEPSLEIAFFSWKKVLATKNISMVNDDHRRDISNCLSCIHYHTFSLLPIGSDTSQSLAAGVPRSPDALPAASARSTTGAPILAWPGLAGPRPGFALSALSLES